MGKKDPQLTQEEIWDDSALIASWNEALAEYKKYHSIYKDGGTLGDLKELEKESHRPLEEDAEEDIAVDRPEDGKPSQTNEPIQENAPPAAAASPQAVLGTVKDENLKKLLMSWYYAGYYTGLYEGSQQATLDKS